MYEDSGTSIRYGHGGTASDHMRLPRKLRKRIGKSRMCTICRKTQTNLYRCRKCGSPYIIAIEP